MRNRGKQNLVKTGAINNNGMKYKDMNLTRFFSEYLTHHSERTKGLNATDIALACYGALNEVDADLNLADVIYDMRSDFEYIYKVIEKLAGDIIKNESSDKRNQRKQTPNDEYYTIPEAASVYNITQQAIRKACKEKRLPYKDGCGKNKYLIRKADIDLYMSHAKGKTMLTDIQREGVVKSA